MLTPDIDRWQLKRETLPSAVPSTYAEMCAAIREHWRELFDEPSPHDDPDWWKGEPGIPMAERWWLPENQPQPVVVELPPIEELPTDTPPFIPAAQTLEPALPPFVWDTTPLPTGVYGSSSMNFVPGSVEGVGSGS